MRHASDVGRHGELLSEATSPQADATYYGPDAIRYVTHGPFTNHAEKSYEDKMKADKDLLGDDANVNGMYWTVEKKVY